MVKIIEGEHAPLYLRYVLVAIIVLLVITIVFTIVPPSFNYLGIKTRESGAGKSPLPPLERYTCLYVVDDNVSTGECSVYEESLAKWTWAIYTIASQCYPKHSTFNFSITDIHEHTKYTARFVREATHLFYGEYLATIYVNETPIASIAYHRATGRTCAFIDYYTVIVFDKEKTIEFVDKFFIKDDDKITIPPIPDFNPWHPEEDCPPINEIK